MTDEEKAEVILCVGAHWPDDFIPEDDLLEAVNEFLRLPNPSAFVSLIRERKIFLRVGKRDDCWLRFGVRDHGD